MGNSISLYFRPVETKITETQNNDAGIYYTIETKVRFFTDEAMTKVAYEKDFVFERVQYNRDWDGILSDIYILVNQSI